MSEKVFSQNAVPAGDLLAEAVNIYSVQDKVSAGSNINSKCLAT